MIGSDFEWHEYPTLKRCSECGKKSRRVMVSRWKGKIRKIVCSEDCRLEFDARYWYGRAEERRIKASRRVALASQKAPDELYGVQMDDEREAEREVLEEWERNL